MSDKQADTRETFDRVLRRNSLRRQVALLEGLREALQGEPMDQYERFADALEPLTDKILHELMALEGVPPYPHPRGFWDDIYELGIA